jgi:hypothetical protein
MSSGVGVHPQRLLRIIVAVQEELSPERQRPLVLSFKIPGRRDHEIQVQLLRDRPLRPCRLGSLATCWNATRVVPVGCCSTSQSSPAGSGSSSPDRYRKPSSSR